MANDLRALIRELLAEEIASLRAEMRGAVQEEHVRIGTAADLTAFALSMMRRASDPTFAAALREGRIQFVPELSATPPTFVPMAQPADAPFKARPPTLVTTVPATVPELMKPLITERDIAAVAEGETRLRIGRRSRLTPLAGDEARRRGIRIERSTK
ncbi:hypothetical protein AOQ72_00080 [Bradyrhizobium yuanmingense]|uniref:Uncharacterized protein n=1 Tax=Bradyrhizobium yuanmingense TaxID=108015 RepID=A0A0R3C336_9BRAD|nr:hypothetical protein [Bradyrhizobium yuanmingense]KRP89524.1 hypothetical protein AOQ72_00080 [Bradyrhizobium yuanmingense]